MHQMTRSLAALPLLALLIPQIVLAHGPTAPPTRPVFVYPAERQTIPYSGSWSFAVRSMKGARGFLWSFVQDGVIRWQNLTFEHSLSGRTYTIASGSTAHRHLHPGWLWVWVQALLSHDRWSGVTTLTVVLRTPPPPTATPTLEPVDTPTPQPTSTPSAPVLYTADWSSGLNGWTGPNSWKAVGGMLVSDGSSANPILAPFQPATANYAIEAEVRIDATDCNNYFALVARLTQNGFYGAGDSWPSSCSATGYVDAWDSSNKYHDVAGANNTPDPGHGWHTYRLEIKDNKITFSFDGSVLVSANDNRYLDAGQVGLLTSGVQLSVRSFKVIAL